MNKLYDYLIIGAGIIGLSIARELHKRYPHAKIILLEKESSIGLHASGRNSGVLHTGIYYPAGTLKAQFCKRGADLLFAFAEENNISVRRNGKLIIASSESQINALSSLLNNAKNSQISAELVTGKDILEIEPYACSNFGGIYCKDTAVIDSPAVIQKIKNELEYNQISIDFNQKIRKIEVQNQSVHTDSGIYHYGFLINTAGAYADSVAKLMQIGLEYFLIPFKGTYYQLKPEADHLLRSSIYPVPDPNLPFLGVHITRSINGKIYIGPTIIPTLGRENYTLFCVFHSNLITDFTSK